MSEPEVLIDFGDDRLDPTQRAVRSAAFRRLLDTGQPSAIKAIAQHSRLPGHVVTDVLEALAERGMAQLEDGQLMGIAGLGVTPTRHKLVLSQGERWTWCALDAIGIVGAVGSGTITSHTPEGVDVILSLDNGVFHPEGWAIFVADGYGMTSSIGQWCPLVDFFPDEVSADRWAEQNQVLGRGVAVARLASVTAGRWRGIIDDM